MTSQGLYQATVWRRAGLVALLILGLAACAAPSMPSPVDGIEITIFADGEETIAVVPAGSSVAEALANAGLELGELDRSEPPTNTQLDDGTSLNIIRVEEEFETEVQPLPFESTTLHNESLPLGEQRIIQIGENGEQEVTYRLLYEDGELVSRKEVASEVIAEAVDEIIMIGAQAPASSTPLNGRLAFISAGNAWLTEGNSSARRPVAIAGDLDGRVFEISPDGQWLLFTRASADPDQINTLWVASLDEGSDIMNSLGVQNVVHYAGWVPGTNNQVAFSTVDPSLNPPGWQANNDLRLLNVTANGSPASPRTGLPPRSDSLYAWWGSDYAWSPGGESLAYAQPDSVGLADISRDELDELLPLTTYQTGSDWAWMPTLSWAPDGLQLFTVEHSEQPGLANQEQSQAFDVISISVSTRQRWILANSAGMFAAPQASPLLDGGDYLVAYLQAYNPLQSDISAYQLYVSDIDGSGARLLFPPSGVEGLQPHPYAWSPAPDGADGSLLIAVVYQGNLWLINALSGHAQQLTSDGLVSAVAWGE